MCSYSCGALASCSSKVRFDRATAGVTYSMRTSEKAGSSMSRAAWNDSRSASRLPSAPSRIMGFFSASVSLPDASRSPHSARVTRRIVFDFFAVALKALRGFTPTDAFVSVVGAS